MIRRVLILVEGQTEEKFVKDVLNPAFSHCNLFFNVRILTTKRVKNGPDFKGESPRSGNSTTMQYAVVQLQRRLSNHILDYYGLPTISRNEYSSKRSAMQR